MSELLSHRQSRLRQGERSASSSFPPSGLLTVSVLLLRRPSCAESLSKLQLLLLEGNWSRFSPERFSSSLLFGPPDSETSPVSRRQKN